MKKSFLIILTMCVMSFNIKAASDFSLYHAEDVTDVFKTRLKTYVGLTLVHRDQEGADGYGGSDWVPYTGVALSFRAAQSATDPKALWYAVVRFMPKSSSEWSTSGSVESKVEIRCWIDKSSYRGVYGEDFSDVAIGPLRVDDTLGTYKSKLYFGRTAFEWRTSSHATDPSLDSHTTLKDVIKLVDSMKSPAEKFPFYTFVGISYLYDSVNCCGFGLRGLKKFGVNIDAIPDLAIYLSHEYAKPYLGYMGLGYFGYFLRGPKYAKPDRMIKILRDRQEDHHGTEKNRETINPILGLD